MSLQSEAVKKWRKRSKNRIIAAMGNGCNICGYNRCTDALAFHHLDPSKKDFILSDVRTSPKSWDKIINELRKCILVCHNCHSEIHANLIKFELKSSFKEELSDYKELEKNIVKLTPCAFCESLKKDTLKYCSKACRYQSRYKIDWNTIDLLKELENKTVVQIASELGCSDGAVHKRLKKMGLK